MDSGLRWRSLILDDTANLHSLESISLVSSCGARCNLVVYVFARVSLHNTVHNETYSAMDVMITDHNTFPCLLKMVTFPLQISIVHRKFVMRFRSVLNGDIQGAKHDLIDPR